MIKKTNTWIGLHQRAFAFFEGVPKRVVLDNLYSVPFHLIHQKVNIRATEKMVEIFHQGKSVAIHQRNYHKARYTTL
ncbi:MAG: hypothetical protein FP831_17935 [Anaerolineae bacterium]|nr:hypothetical protein [Anaerolineae bacterium]